MLKCKLHGTLRNIARTTLTAGMLTATACGGQMPFSGNINVAGDPPPLPPPPPVKKVEAPKPPPRVEVRDNKIEIREKIQFGHAKADILEASHGLLNEIVQVIKANPHIKKLSIEGHASSEGNPGFNKRLSGKRAESVVTYLEEHGIADGRLVAAGFGSEKPIADNDTETGREKNRRVEFNILEQDVTKKKVEIDPATGKERLLSESTEKKKTSPQPAENE